MAAAKRGASPRREGPSVGTLGPSKATPSRRKKVPVESEYVGVDLHRRRSVIVRMSPDGEQLSTVKIDNDPLALAAAIAPAGANPPRRGRSDVWVVLGRRRPGGVRRHAAP